MDFTLLFSSIKAAGCSPLSFAAYCVAAVAWLVISYRVARSNSLLKHIKSIPADERRGALADAYGGLRLKEGMSAQEFIRARIHRYLFWAFVAVVLVIGTVAAVATFPKLNSVVVQFIYKITRHSNVPPTVITQVIEQDAPATDSKNQGQGETQPAPQAPVNPPQPANGNQVSPSLADHSAQIADGSQGQLPAPAAIQSATDEGTISGTITTARENVKPASSTDAQPFVPATDINAKLAEYLRWRGKKAFAVSKLGHSGRAIESTLEDAKNEALTVCRRFATASGDYCYIYYEDNIKVAEWPPR